MSKEEFLKIQKCVLKVNIHCDGCKHKVKKILQKIDGVFTTDIDSEQGKVTVSGNVDPAILIKRLAKSGKHGELWGAPKANNNQSNLPNQFKNMQIDNGKSGNNGGKGGQKGGGGGGGNNQPKSGQKPQQQQQQQQNQQQQQQNQQLQQQQLQQLQQMQQLQQLQQMKGFQDLKLPQLKGMQMPPNFKDQKAVKFNMREEEDLSDDEYDDLDDDDDYDYDNDELDDDMDEPHHPLTKGKPVMMGSGGQGMPPNMGMMKGNHPQMMNTAAQKGGGGNGGAQNGGGAVVNGKKGGGSGGGPVPVGGGNNEGKNGSGGKKGGGGGGDQHHNQGAGGGKNGGKSGGSPLDGKNGGGGNAKNGNGSQGGPNGSMNNGNGGKKGGGGGGGGGGMSEVQAMNNAFQNMGGRPQGMPGVSVGQMGNMNMGMGSMGSMPMSQMGNIPAVQGLPAGAMNGGGGGGAGGGYFQGAGPEAMPGNPYQQQQYLQAVMNQQRAMGNERFQPMMYARPPPAVNYMPPGPPQPYPYPYPYAPPPAGEPYTHFFSDENTSSCNVM